MRKLGRTSSDALELLLDTVCSMFGAILLIAILVALMAQTAKVETPADQASSDMVRRRIAVAEADLASTQRLIAATPVAMDNSAAALASDRKQMEDRLAAAKAEREKMGTQIQEQVERETIDFSTEWKKLVASLRAIQQRQEETANAIKTQDQNTSRLNGRVADISKLIQKEKDARIVTLRFPKERARLKRSLSVICKFGKIYPILETDGRKNTTTIAWKTKGADSELSLPIEELGWTATANKEAIFQFLRTASKDRSYLAFYVYPDSFDAFRFMRDQAVAEQWEFGVELERPGDELLWGAKGSSPPPL